MLYPIELQGQKKYPRRDLNPDFPLRRRTLYPIELRGQTVGLPGPVAPRRLLDTELPAPLPNSGVGHSEELRDLDRGH